MHICSPNILLSALAVNPFLPDSEGLWGPSPTYEGWGESTKTSTRTPGVTEKMEFLSTCFKPSLDLQSEGTTETTLISEGPALPKSPADKPSAEGTVRSTHSRAAAAPGWSRGSEQPCGHCAGQAQRWNVMALRPPQSQRGLQTHRAV